MAFIELVDEPNTGGRLIVIGVGGGGSNAVDHMMEARITGVEFIVVNTDAQALERARAPLKMQVGAVLTKGRGSGGNPEVGKQAALEDVDLIRETLKGAEMVFVTAGFGGGTGTGAGPVIAEVARNMGALTVGIVTRPFHFEGKPRHDNAKAGIEELRKCVDTLIVVPNQRLLEVEMVNKSTTIVEAFRMADDILRQGVECISGLITMTGLINLDLNDVRRIMSNTGSALMGVGSASGEGRATTAARKAITSPLLESSDMSGATGVIINIVGGTDLALYEVNEAATIISKAADREANVIFGAVIDPDLTDEIKVTVIATGFKTDEERAQKAVAHETGRPMELFSFEELASTPAFARHAAGKKMKVAHTKSNEKLYKENLEVPTFIRRKGMQKVSCEHALGDA
ncbi:MAG: cell division protein FtsZ [Candidatus Abyssobacteria bacterium SURF_17]|uniref:Cell division protein FtsZ n=1 Tax=Candidatus Abyssobacteria bacterium SURF_17 TaxID=2093361 RepID=A0A419F7P5_9BACT|nr:MAG: cell division protein FtsZ [Candidatus Abyssubacteria bacterium SURF_17]